jgi:hypothetical protein
MTWEVTHEYGPPVADQPLVEPFPVELAPEDSLPARANEGLPLTPGERLLAVTLLGLPVQKDAA